MDILTPFLTFCDDNPDFNQADDLRAIQELSVRQGLIEDWIEGNEHTDTVLDCLQDQGVGADEYIAAVTANVAYVLDGGIPYIENESGLLLPGHF